MKQFVIIDIRENIGDLDGHTITVKANPIEEEPGFKHLEKMFDKKYYSYAVTESSETEIFEFPYTVERMNSLTEQANRLDKDNFFWAPNIDDFDNTNMMFPFGDIRKVHKHKSFKDKRESRGMHIELYYIVVVHSFCDLNYGQIISVHAIPFKKLISKGLSDLSFKSEDMEYFYLRSENNISQTLSLQAKHWKLWKVNLKDYTIKNDYVQDVFQKKNLKHDINIHNSIIGKSYTDILDFDYMSADMRIQILQKKDDSDIVDIQFSDLNDDFLDKDVTAELPV